MGGISINPAGVYGAARGFQDLEDRDRTARGFEADQAIRTERLKNEQVEAPIRRESLQLGLDQQRRQVARQPAQDAYNDAIQKMSMEEKQAAFAKLQKSLKDRETLNKSLSLMLGGGDPQGVADALGQAYPEQWAGSTLVRNEDGTMTMTTKNGQPQTIASMKGPDGKERKPEEMLGFLAQKYLDPLKHFEEEQQTEMKQRIEGQKTERAISVAQATGGSRERAATTRAGATVDAANARANSAEARDSNRSSEVWKSRQMGQIKPVLDSILKTTGVSGSFISGYAHDNDAELRASIEEATEAEIMSGTPVRKAARAAVEDARSTYDKADKLAKAAAAGLAKAKINPRDRKAVEEAAKTGNADATKLLQVLDAAQESLGPSIAKYLTTQLPVK